MLQVNTYLNFAGNAEEAFNFYKSVFGTEFIGFSRFKDVENLPGKEDMSEEELEGVMHVALPILGGHWLMGTDVPKFMLKDFQIGNNVSISLHPESKEQADELFAKLSAGGKVTMPMQDMFWGDYYGSFEDKFGVCWMINYGPEDNLNKAS